MLNTLLAQSRAKNAVYPTNHYSREDIDVDEEFIYEYPRPAR